MAFGPVHTETIAKLLADAAEAQQLLHATTVALEALMPHQLLGRCFS